MVRHKGVLRIFTGEGADSHPDWCSYEEGEWIDSKQVDVELKKKDEIIAMANQALKFYADAANYLFLADYNTSDGRDSYVHDDKGKIAREYLAKMGDV